MNGTLADILLLVISASLANAFRTSLMACRYSRECLNSRNVAPAKAVAVPSEPAIVIEKEFAYISGSEIPRFAVEISSPDALSSLRF